MRSIPKILVSAAIFLVTLGILLYVKAMLFPALPAIGTRQVWSRIKPGNTKLYPELQETMLTPLSEGKQNLYYGDKHLSSTHVSVNSFGLRDREKEPPKKSHFILAGCSYVFGHGLEYKDMISTHLGKMLPEVNVRNIGHPGGGLHTSLRYLEIVDPRLWAPEPEGHFVFVSIDDHFARFLHHPSYLVWAPGNAPFYMRDGGKVKYGGVLEDVKRYNVIQFLKEFGLEGFYPSGKDTYNDEKIAFMIDGVIELKRRYLEKYPKGKFTWVLHPLSGLNTDYGDKVRELTKKNGIEFIELSSFMRWVYRNKKAKEEEQFLPYDRHPSGLNNKIFATWLRWHFSERPLEGRD